MIDNDKLRKENEELRQLMSASEAATNLHKQINNILENITNVHPTKMTSEDNRVQRKPDSATMKDTLHKNKYYDELSMCSITDPRIFMNESISALFTQDILQKSSLTGKAFGPFGNTTKEKLDEEKMNAILDYAQVIFRKQMDKAKLKSLLHTCARIKCNNASRSIAQKNSDERNQTKPIVESSDEE